MRTRFFILSLLLILLWSAYTPQAYAHGLVYKTEPLEDNKLRIHLMWSQPEEEKGIAISYFYLKNGKTLYIGYESRQDAPVVASMDFDLSSALPPLRIVIANNGDAPEGNLFHDIHGIEAEEYIRHLHDAGIVNGRGQNLFMPFASITRAEFMVLMVKALKLEGTPDGTTPFKDIANHWAKETLLLAAKHKLISGYEDQTVRPNNPITLAEASTVIARAFHFKTVKNGIYNRLTPNMWYSDAIKKMFDTGILRTSDGLYQDFDEEASINRANCAMMISRAMSTY